jgi:hypothetical protein
MHLITNFKQLSPEPMPIASRLIVVSKNEGGKSAVGSAFLAATTKVVQDETLRQKSSGRTLTLLRRRSEDTLFATVHLGSGEGSDPLASWVQEGRGNPKVTGPVGGQLVNVWTEIRGWSVGTAPKMALAILESPFGQEKFPGAEGAIETYRAAWNTRKRVKGSEPAKPEVIPADPSEEVLNAFRSHERAVRNSAELSPGRRAIVSAVAKAARFKDGKRQLALRERWAADYAKAQTQLESATQDLLAVAAEAAEALVILANINMAEDEEVRFDLAANQMWFVRDGEEHRAFSGTGSVRLVHAVGSALYGEQGVLLVPDVGWDGGTLRKFLATAAMSALGYVWLTLPALSAKAELPAPWQTLRLS